MIASPPGSDGADRNQQAGPDERIRGTPGGRDAALDFALQFAMKPRGRQDGPGIKRR
jgi:hypothetical protein